MGDELCCSRESQFDIIKSNNSNNPETNIISQKNYSKRNNMNNNDILINNLDENIYNNNSYYFIKPKFKDYKIQKSQNMYIKPTIKQNYSYQNTIRNKYMKNSDRNNINNFSIEIKGRPKNGVKKKVLNENNNNGKFTYFYNENEVENINNNDNNINENENMNNSNMINNNEIKISYHQNDINNSNEIENNFNKNERKNFSESLYSNVEENPENNNINNNINMNKEEVIENQMNNLIDNKTIIENKEIGINLDNNILKNDNLITNENNQNTNMDNDIIYDSDNPKDEDENNQINTEIITNGSNNIQQNNNSDVYKNSSIFETIKYNQDNIKTSNIKNFSPNLNLNQNPTFAPTKTINNNNIINSDISKSNQNQNISLKQNENETKISKNSNNYSKIFESIDTNIANNPSELQKVLDIIDNNKYNKQDPVLSDEEVDDLIKKAEKTNFKSTIPYLPKKNIVYHRKNNQQYQNYTQIPSKNMKYSYPLNDQKRKVIIQNGYNKNGIIQNNVLLTPERKKVTHPLTPDYQIKKNKIINTNPYNKYYNNNNYTPIINKKPSQNQYNLLTNPQKKSTNYYNQYNNYVPGVSKTFENNVKYHSPQKIVKANGQNYYLLTPPRNQVKETYVQSPTKVNPPIVQYSEKYFVASPITISKALPATDTPESIKKYLMKNRIPSKKVYQHKNITSQKPSQIVYTTSNPNNVNNVNNINPIKNSSKNSFINHSYLNKIQQMNQNNALINTSPNKSNNLITNLNPNNVSNINNNKKYLDLSFSSINSGISKTPKKLDKFGNPIYSASLHSSPKRLNNYENYKLRQSLSSKSVDDLSAPIQRRRNKFDDYYDNKHKNYSPSSYESPISTPKSNKKINYNMNQFNNTKKSNINNLIKSTTKVSVYEEDKDSTISIIDSTQAPTGLKIDEHTNQIINKYLSTDMTEPNTFHKGSYNLFYFNSPEFFRIPQAEIVSKKKLIYNINNNPEKQAFYEGEVNYLNQRHGLGKIKYEDTVQIGMWRNNNFSGWGRIIKRNGQAFEGKFNNGVLNGKGVYKYKDVLYVGNFENGIRQGKGVLFTKNFNYQGQFTQGKIDGYGKIVFIEPHMEECEYEGFFKNNKIEGNGLMKWKNGNMYQGEMKDGKMNGRGRFIPKDGIPSDGIFKDNVKVNA